VIGVGGAQPSPSHLPGSAANAALIVFTKGFGREMAHHNVRVNAVSPAGVATERLQSLMQAIAEREGISIEEIEEATRRSSAATPLGRPARPEEVADAVLFLASERSGYFAATNLIMDGGSVGAV
jgi:NAD(P)-dependent dehydrogenase (short-subunit alcohol dehydrogenase family)